MKKQVLVSVDRGETRVALLEATGHGRRRAETAADAAAAKSANPAAGYRVAELYLERRGGRSIVGNIYKGKVDNVLAGLEAAFVDIGLEKNGFLHVDEIVLPGVETPQARPRPGGKDGHKIPDLLKPGQEIVVQVVKDPLKTKGARLSMELAIPGRYMVYSPQGEGVGVSRRLDDKERERLRKEAARLDLQGGGAIIRTAAYGARARRLRARAAVPLQAPRGAREARRGDAARPTWSSRRPTCRCASCATSSPSTSSARSSTTRSSTSGSISFFTRTAPELVDRVELWEDEHAAVRALRRRERDRRDALAPRRPAERRLPDDRLRRGADGDRRQHRLVHRPRQRRAAGGHDHEERTSRRPRRSCASCGCATSAASSSSTSSTWRARATATPC